MTFIIFMMLLIPLLGVCTCNLATVDRECGRNAPGMKTVFWLACVDDATSIGAATAHVVATITMVATKVFFPIHCIRKDNGLKSTPGEDGGFTTEGTYFISKQAAAKSNILTGLAAEENYIAITEDQNAQKDILGSTTHPIKVKITPTKTPKNGYEVKLVWDGHSDIPFIFSGTVPV